MSDAVILDRAVEAIATADALLIGAGAGMGVDSGLPDFRGNEGFWRAYPPYARLGLRFTDLANPAWFARDPEFGWGFYGHRLNLYRQATPHAGFSLLRRWAERMMQGYFVYTSNVDGHFEKAGFPPERVLEVHGSIHWMQCTRFDCRSGLFPAGDVTVDEHAMRAVPPLPACLECGSLARPNILMFGDGAWNEIRSFEQEKRFRSWRDGLKRSRLVIVECGAGKAVPTVRYMCEDMARRLEGTLIRINTREPEVPSGQLSLNIGALAALQEIERRLK